MRPSTPPGYAHFAESHAATGWRRRSFLCSRSGVRKTHLRLWEPTAVALHKTNSEWRRDHCRQNRPIDQSAPAAVPAGWARFVAIERDRASEAFPKLLLATGDAGKSASPLRGPADATHNSGIAPSKRARPESAAPHRQNTGIGWPGFSRRSTLELKVIELLIDATLFHQLVVCGLLHNPTLVQHYNHIGLLNCGQSMRDANGGAALHQFFK